MIKHNQQRGSVTFNVLAIIAVVVIVFLGYLLLTRTSGDGTSRTVSIASPEMDFDAMPQTINGKFNDGLSRPDTVSVGTLDEYGAGVARTEIFTRDINGDGRNDRITRRRIENGTDHFYYDYKIELNTKNGFINITPDAFRTTEGVECALTKLRFIFTPNFRVEKISRDWRDTWVTPTTAYKTIYTLRGTELNAGMPQQMRDVCNVADLF